MSNSYSCFKTFHTQVYSQSPILNLQTIKVCSTQGGELALGQHQLGRERRGLVPWDEAEMVAASTTCMMCSLPSWAAQHGPSRFCICWIAGAELKRPTATNCILPRVKEQTLPLPQETFCGFLVPKGFNGSYFSAAGVLGARKHRLGLHIRTTDWMIWELLWAIHWPMQAVSETKHGNMETYIQVLFWNVGKTNVIFDEATFKVPTNSESTLQLNVMKY